MLKTPGLIGSFAQGMQIPEQFFNNEARLKQAHENLLRSQILDKYLPQQQQDLIQGAGDRHLAAHQNLMNSQVMSKFLPQRQQDLLRQAQDAHNAAALAIQGAPQVSNLAHLKAIANIYKAIQPPSKGVQTGYDAQGRPTLSMGGSSGVGRTPVPPELLKFLGTQGATQPGATPGTISPPGSSPTAFQANLMTGMGRGAQGKQFVSSTGQKFTPYSKTSLDKWQMQNSAIEKMMPIYDALMKAQQGTSTAGYTLDPTARGKVDSFRSQLAEQIMKARNLPNTSEGLQTARDQVTPVWGEPNESIMNRLRANKNEYASQRMLNMHKIRAAGTYSGRDQSQQGLQTETKDIPTFKNKEDFQNWMKTASQSQIKAEIAKLQG